MKLLQKSFTIFFLLFIQLVLLISSCSRFSRTDADVDDVPFHKDSRFRPPGAVTTSYDLNSLPTTVTLTNVEIISGQLVLSQDGAGNYFEEGSLDIPVSASSVSGKLLQITSEHPNLVANGDFESAGFWSGTGLSIISDPDDATNHVVKLARNKNIKQYFPITPGEIYTVKFDADLTRLYDDPADGEDSDDDQELIVKLGFHDASYRNITYLSPKTSVTATSPISLHWYYAEDTGDNIHLKFQTMDCDTHTKYTAGTGTYASDVTFNMCQDTSGNALTATSEDGTSTEIYDVDDIQYASLDFLAYWFGTSASPSNYADYYPLLDNIVVTRDKDVEVQILDGSGNVLQTSTVEEGFYVEKNSSISKIRIVLRSDKTDATPSVSAISIKDGWDLAVTVGSVIAEYDEPRLGGLMVTGALTDYNNPDIAIRATCKDPIQGDEISCMTLKERYNILHNRLHISSGYFDIEKNSTNTDYDIELNEDGETKLKRVIELMGYGVQPIFIIVKDGYFKYNDPDDGKSYAVATYVNELPDPAGIRSEAEQNIYLMQKYTRFLANLFDGSTTYTFQYVDAGTAIAVPKIETFEIFNEDNITETAWLGAKAWGASEDDATRNALAEPMADLSEILATEILAEIPDAEISFTGLAVHRGDVFDTDDLTTYLDYLDISSFSTSNFHPYTDDGLPDSLIEETISTGWDETSAILASHGFSGKKNIFGEYGYTREIYDPSCAYDESTTRYEVQSSPNLTWEQGYGVNKFAKLLARETLSLLALPADMILPYGMSNYGEENDGFEGGGYTCWRSESKYNFHVVDHDPTTGIIAGVDEPQYYTVNAGGTAYLTIAKHLSESSPMTTSVSSTDSLEANDGNNDYNAKMFRTGDNEYVLALWWSQAQDYGDVVPWMSYMSGQNDEGFTEKRVFNVALTGVSGLNKATLIFLDGSAEQELDISESSGTTILNGVVASELPSLIKMEFDASIADTDNDGLADSIDPNPKLKNTWWWVNRDKARMSLVSTGKSYSFVRGSKVSGKVMSIISPSGVKVDGVLDASKAQTLSISACPEAKSAIDLSSKKQTIASAISSSVSNLTATSKYYGLCIQNFAAKIELKNDDVDRHRNRRSPRWRAPYGIGLLKSTLSLRN